MNVYLIEKITHKDKNTPLVRSGNRSSSIVPLILAIDDVIKKRQYEMFPFITLSFTFKTIKKNLIKCCFHKLLNCPTGRFWWQTSKSEENMTF